MREFNFIPEKYLDEKSLKINIIVKNIIKVLIILVIASVFILNKTNKKLELLKREQMGLKTKETIKIYELKDDIFYLWDYSISTLKNYTSLEKVELNKNNLNLSGTGDIKDYESLLKILEDNKNIKLLEFKSPNEENEFQYTIIAEVGKNEK